MKWMACLLALAGAAALGGCSACTATDTSRLEPRGGTDAGAADGGPCAAGRIACGTICINPLTDSAHCGECGNTCGRGERCMDGVCVCPPGAMCGEVGLGDPNDCGGRTCDHLEACVDGRCRCRAGRTRVGEECVDLSSDPDNCGVIGNQCDGDTVCAGGMCRASCPIGTQECDDACVRLTTDPAHCGECGNQCDRTEFCSRGSCTAYRAGTGCVTCPCDACEGDFATCCVVSGGPGLVACVEAEACL